MNIEWRDYLKHTTALQLIIPTTLWDGIHRQHFQANNHTKRFKHASVIANLHPGSRTAWYRRSVMTGPHHSGGWVGREAGCVPCAGTTSAPLLLAASDMLVISFFNFLSASPTHLPRIQEHQWLPDSESLIKSLNALLKLYPATITYMVYMVAWHGSWKFHMLNDYFTYPLLQQLLL